MSKASPSDLYCPERDDTEVVFVGFDREPLRRRTRGGGGQGGRRMKGRTTYKFIWRVPRWGEEARAIHVSFYVCVCVNFICVQLLCANEITLIPFVCFLFNSAKACMHAIHRKTERKRRGESNAPQKHGRGVRCGRKQRDTCRVCACRTWQPWCSSSSATWVLCYSHGAAGKEDDAHPWRREDAGVCRFGRENQVRGVCRVRGRGGSFPKGTDALGF